MVRNFYLIQHSQKMRPTKLLLAAGRENTLNTMTERVNMKDQLLNTINMAGKVVEPTTLTMDMATHLIPATITATLMCMIGCAAPVIAI